MYPLQNQQFGPGAGYMPQNQVGPQPMPQHLPQIILLH